MKNSPLKVLKLNSGKNWQTRYLTVSKEGTWLNLDDHDVHTLQNNTCFCPLGILWMKNSKGGRKWGNSINKINKHGKGGMHFVDVVHIEMESLGDEEHSYEDLMNKKKLFRWPLFTQKESNSTLAIGQKSQGESAIVRIYSKTNEADGDDLESGNRVVTFMCSVVEAEAITAGCNAIIETLNRNKDQKQQITQQTVEQKKAGWKGKIALTSSYESNNTVGLTRSSCSGASFTGNRQHTVNDQHAESCSGSVSSSQSYVMSQHYRRGNISSANRMDILMDIHNRRNQRSFGYPEDETDDQIPSSVSYYHQNVMSATSDHYKVSF